MSTMFRFRSALSHPLRCIRPPSSILTVECRTQKYNPRLFMHLTQFGYTCAPMRRNLLHLTKTSQFQLTTRGIVNVVNAEVNGQNAESIEWPTRIERQLPNITTRVNDMFSELDENVRNIGRVNWRNLQKVMDLLEHDNCHLSSVQAVMLLRCCGELLVELTPEKRRKVTEDVWSLLKKKQVVFEPRHYANLIRAYIDNHNDFSIPSILELMGEYGIKPDRYVYQQCLKKYCLDGDIDSASTILTQMKEEELPIGVVVFDSFIYGHGFNKEFSEAENVVDVMREAGVVPTSNTYTALACVYAAVGDIDNVVKWIECEKDRAEDLTDQDLMKVIYTLCSHGFDEQVEKVLPFLRKHEKATRHHAINILYRLLQNDKEEEAFKLLQQFDDTLGLDLMTYAGRPDNHYFLGMMVMSDRPPETIMKYCRETQTEQDEMKTCSQLSYLTWYCLCTAKVEHALYFIREMHAHQMPIREHYFWPILAQHGKENRFSSVEETLKIMEEFNVIVSQETFADYVFPHVQNVGIDEVIKRLATSKLSQKLVAAYMLEYFVAQRDIDSAKHIVANHRYKYTNQLPATLSSAINVENVDDILDIACGIQNYLRHVDVLGSLMLEFMRTVRKYPHSVVVSVLSGFVKLQFPIHEDNAVHMEKLLQTRVELQPYDSYISAILSCVYQEQAQPTSLTSPHTSLTSPPTLLTSPPHTSHTSPPPTLLTSPFDESWYDGNSMMSSQVNPPPPPLSSMSVEQLEGSLQELKSKGMNTRGVLRHLFLKYCPQGNKDRVLEIRQELDESGYIYTAGMYAALLELAALTGDLNLCMEAKHKLETDYKTFMLDGGKIMKVSKLFIDNGLMEEAIKFLDDSKDRIHTPREPRHDNYNLSSRVNEVLKAIVSKGDVRGMEVVSDIIFTHYDNPHSHLENKVRRNHFLQPLIAVHLHIGDIQGAIDAFERVITTYGYAVCSQELMRVLAAGNDTDNLQRVVNLTCRAIDEFTMLHWLATAFLEAGAFDTAANIFRTPGLRAKNKFLEYQIGEYISHIESKSDRFVSLCEQLRVLTEGLFDMDQSVLCDGLLFAYSKVNDVGKAEELLRDMESKGIVPSQQFSSVFAQMMSASQSAGSHTRA